MNNHLDFLVEKADFGDHLQISKHGDFDKFMHPHILNAQMYDVRPSLGDNFFIDVIDNEIEANYVLLLEGGSYTYQNKKYFFEGLKKVIVHYSFARYVMQSGSIDTPTGLVIKKSEHSEPIDAKATARENEYHRSLASAALNDIIDFLKRKRQDYPLFECEIVSVSKKTRITPVHRY